LRTNFFRFFFKKVADVRKIRFEKLAAELIVNSRSEARIFRELWRQIEGKTVTRNVKKMRVAGFCEARTFFTKNSL